MWNCLNYMMSMNFDGGIKFNFSTPGSTITSLSLTLSYYTPLIPYFYSIISILYSSYSITSYPVFFVIFIFIISPSFTLTYSIYHKTNSFSITKSILSSIPYFTSLLPIPAFIPLYILPHLPTLFITLTLFPLSSLLAPILLPFISTSFLFSIFL